MLQSLGVTVQHQNNRLDLEAMTQRCRSDVAVAECKWALKVLTFETFTNVNLNMVNSKFHLIQTFFKIFATFLNLPTFSMLNWMDIPSTMESVQWRIQDFPGGGGANFQGGGYKPIIWPNFYRKLHENERIWTEKGGACPWRPLDPPTL